MKIANKIKIMEKKYRGKIKISKKNNKNFEKKIKIWKKLNIEKNLNFRTKVTVFE